VPADQALRELEHALRAAPGDLALARRYRDTLRRHAAQAAAGVSARLDRLQGVLALTRDGETGPARDPAPNGWRRLAAGAAPLLGPEAPADGPLRQGWALRGELRFLNAGVALVQTPDQGLEARALDRGTRLWRVEAELPVDALDTDDERHEGLGWVVAPWGAARVAARFERDPQRRRVGRHTPRGRVTEREVVGHGEAAVEAVLQVLIDTSGWSEPPEALAYWAHTGEPLADSDLALEDFHDELLALSLDAQSRTLALRWRDASQDWAVLSVSGGAGLSHAVGPAGWSLEPPDDPFDDADPTLPLPAPPTPPLGAELCPTDGGWLAVGPGSSVARATATGWTPCWTDWPLEPLLEGRRLRAQGPGSPDKDAALLVADGRLLLQTDTLSVWEAA